MVLPQQAFHFRVEEHQIIFKLGEESVQIREQTRISKFLVVAFECLDFDRVEELIRLEILLFDFGQRVGGRHEDVVCRHTECFARAFHFEGLRLEFLALAVRFEEDVPQFVWSGHWPTGELVFRAVEVAFYRRRVVFVETQVVVEHFTGH